MTIWEKHPKDELVALEIYRSGETSITDICRQLCKKELTAKCIILNPRKPSTNTL